MCSKFASIKFMHYKCFDMKSHVRRAHFQAKSRVGCLNIEEKSSIDDVMVDSRAQCERFGIRPGGRWARIAFLSDALLRRQACYRS